MKQTYSTTIQNLSYYLLTFAVLISNNMDYSILFYKLKYSSL